MTAPQVKDPRTGFTTPDPTSSYVKPAPPPTLLDRRGWEMDHHEKMRLRAAAFRATKLWPGPVGKLIERELLSFEEFGQRLDHSGLIMRAVHDILTGDTPRAEPATVTAAYTP